MQDRFKSLGRIGKEAARRILPGLKRLAGLKRIAPPVIFGLAVFALLLGTGLGDSIAENLAVLTGPIPAALLVIGISFIPAISPLTGPGLLIVFAAGLFAGEQIAAASVTPFMALPLFFALDAWIGGGFAPRGLAFGEDEKETLDAGVPGIVLNRLILLPSAVVITCLLSFGF